MNPSVAFSARLHENTILTNSACFFRTVDVNIGVGYNEFTGKYLIHTIFFSYSYSKIYKGVFNITKYIIVQFIVIGTSKKN